MAGKEDFFLKEEITNTVINNLESRFSERRQFSGVLCQVFYVTGHLALNGLQCTHLIWP